MKLSQLAKELKPYIVPWLNDVGGTANASGALSAHNIDGPYHLGTLSESQAPWAVTDSEFSVHTGNVNAHHARQHDVLSASDHTVTGNAFNLVGLTATDTLGTLTPSSAPGAAEAILKSSAAGKLTLPELEALTKVTTPLIETASGDLTLDPAGTGDVIINGTRPTQFDTSLGDITITANDAGWAFALKAEGSSGSDLGGFGLHGSSDTLTKYWIGPSFSSPYLSITSTGLGIFDTSPSYPLDVTGDARATGTIYADTKVQTPLVTTATGDLTLAPADDLMIDPTSNLTKIASGVSLQADNYASQVTGWRVTHDGQADFRYLFVDEMHAQSFIADLEQALAGGQIITKSVAELYSDFTAPAAGGSTTLTMRDLPSATGMAVFVDGDYIRIREFSRAGGSLSISDCWGTVVLDTAYGASGFDSATRTQRYTFTRSTGADAGTMSSGNVVEADAIILDYGTSGNGFYEVNAIDGLYGANSPYAQIVTWATHPRNQTIRARLGNLYGIWSVSGEYGLYAGEGVTDDDSYLRISSNTVRLNNVPLQLYDSGTQKVNIDSAGTDVWFGDGPGSKKLSWDGATLSVIGQITIQNPADINTGDLTNDAGWTVGATWGTDITNEPTQLSDINGGEGTKLAGIEAGATVGATWGTNLNSIPTRFGNAPGSAGLYLTPTHLGYYNGSAWKAWIASNGYFYFGGNSGAHLEWNGSHLRGLGTDGTTVQWYADSTDGKLHAGRDNVQIHAEGIDLQQDAPVTSDAARSITWWPDINDQTGSPTQTIRALYNGLNQNVLSLEAQPAGGAYTVSRVDLIAGSETVTLYSDGSLTVSPETTINDTLNTQHALPLADNTYDSGSASKRWRAVYADQIIATNISGATMSGQEWEYAGSMVIDANSASNTMLSVVNQGAGSVSMTVNGGTVWHSGNDGASSGLDADLLDGVQGSGYALVGHNHDGVYSQLGHLHDDRYSLLGHNHDGVYAPIVHNHDGVYVPVTRQVIAGNGLDDGGALSGNVTLSHADTSAEPSSDNSGTVFVQDISLDGFGHVTGIESVDVATVLDSRYLKLDGTSTGATSQTQVFTTGIGTNGSYYIDGGRFIDNYGVNNLFVGSESGNQSLTSQRIVALGKRAGTVLSSGNDNVLIGFQSGYAMTTGYSNTFIGSRAGESNVSGNSNLYLGQAAGRYATGSENVAIGGAALGSMTSGIENIGIGFAAGGDSTQGDYNVFIGVRAGRYATSTASNNVVIGRRAGWNLSGDGNIFIGYHAGYNETGSDKLYIGNSSTSLPLIHGDFAISELTFHGDVTVTDDLIVDTTLLVAENAAGDSTIHYTTIGDAVGLNTATISHYSHASTTGYALMQNPLGRTGLNSTSGQQLGLSIAGVDTFVVDTDSLLPRGSLAVDVGAYNRKIRTLYAAELYVETLVAQGVLATIGGRIMVAPTTKLITALTDSVAVIEVEHDIFASGDYVYMKSAPAGVAQTEVIRIATNGVAVTGGYQYSVQRNQDGTGANSWIVGDAVVHYGGVVGEGFIELTATQTSQTHLGPTITHYVRTSTTAWDDVVPVVSEGNLRSFVDYSVDEFGFGTGNDLTLTPTGGFKGLTADRTNGVRLFSVDLTAYDGIAPTVALSSTGNLQLGRDVSNAVTTSFDFTSASGALRVGELGTNKPNFYFDGADMHLRSNTTNVITLANNGSSYFAGAMTIGSSGGIYQGSGTFAAPTTGLKIWNDSGIGRLATYNSGTAQVYFDTTGGLNAGGGDLLLDANGITLVNGTDGSNNLKFKDGSTTTMYAYTYFNSPFTTSVIGTIGKQSSDAASLTLEAIEYGGTNKATILVQYPTIQITGAGVEIQDGDLDMFSNDILDVNDLAVGFSSPLHDIHVQKSATGAVQLALENTDTGGTKYLINSTGTTSGPGAGYLEFMATGQASSNRMSFQGSAGRLGIGVANPAYKLDVNGQAHASSFPTSSDARFKENLQPIVSTLDELTKLQAYHFTWKPEYAAYSEFVEDGEPVQQLGFLAQEVAELFPELITRWRHVGRDGVVTEDAYSVDYARMVPLLVMAIRELKERLDNVRS